MCLLGPPTAGVYVYPTPSIDEEGCDANASHSKAEHRHRFQCAAAQKTTFPIPSNKSRCLSSLYSNIIYIRVICLRHEMSFKSAKISKRRWIILHRLRTPDLPSCTSSLFLYRPPLRSLSGQQPPRNRLGVVPLSRARITSASRRNSQHRRKNSPPLETCPLRQPSMSMCTFMSLRLRPPSAMAMSPLVPDITPRLELIC